MDQVFVTRRLPDAGMTVLRDAGVSFTVGQQDDESGVSPETLLAGVRRAEVYETDTWHARQRG